MHFPSVTKVFTAPLHGPALLHRAVQYLFIVFYAYVGWRFYLFARWAMGESEHFVSRPPAVEAFLPISALLGVKRLFYTGQYDLVHPAGLTILLFALASALLFRKGFCGYLCPIGGVTMLLGRLGTRIGISRRPGTWFSFVLSLPKYVLLFFFVNIIVLNMSIADIEAFLSTPYNMVADTKMLLFFLRPSTLVLVTLGVLILGSMLIPGFWCRGFCPYGALLGLFALFSPVAVRRDEATCVGCRRCTEQCPSRIVVHEKKRVSGPECMGCAECVGVCPEPGALALCFGYSRHAPLLPFWAIAVGVLILMGLFYGWAVLTGHWDSAVPPEMLRTFHRNILQLQHP